METVKRIVVLGFIGLAATWLAGCAKYVTVPVPPRVNLDGFGVIGLVEFETGHDDSGLGELATRQFIETLQAAQPGVPIVELGSAEWVLGSVRSRQFDRDTIRAIGQTHEVDTIITGQLDIKNISSKFAFSSDGLPRVNARVDKQATLSTRLIGTADGATLWTDTSSARVTVGGGNLDGNGHGGVRVSGKGEAELALTRTVVEYSTDDFRGSYVRRRVVEDE